MSESKQMNGTPVCCGQHGEANQYTRPPGSVRLIEGATHLGRCPNSCATTHYSLCMNTELTATNHTITELTTCCWLWAWLCVPPEAWQHLSSA